MKCLVCNGPITAATDIDCPIAQNRYCSTHCNHMARVPFNLRITVKVPANPNKPFMPDMPTKEMIFDHSHPDQLIGRNILQIKNQNVCKYYMKCDFCKPLVQRVKSRGAFEELFYE